MSRHKSILLQVAYKGVVDSGRPLTEENVVGDYNLLVGLHDKLGINLDEEPQRSGGGGGRKPAPKASTFETPESVTTFIYEGEMWEDFRAAKSEGSVKKGFPDFKAVNIKDDRGQRKSVWMYDQEGNPNPEAQPLVTAADGAEPFSS